MGGKKTTANREVFLGKSNPKNCLEIKDLGIIWGFCCIHDVRFEPRVSHMLSKWLIPPTLVLLFSLRWHFVKSQGRP